MTETAEAQLRRVLMLVPELADDAEHGIDALADALGVDRATLLADLHALVERLDDPAGFSEEGIALYIERERVSLSSPHFRRPMRLTAAEACALELGLAMLEAERPPEEHRAIVTARDRLRALIAVLPQHVATDDSSMRHAVLATDGARVDHLAVVRDATRTHRKLRLAYRGRERTPGEPRVVRPYAVAVASGAWYLVAHCERAEGMRVFRLDRVESATLLPDDAFSVPENFSIDAHVQNGRVLSLHEPPPTMTVRYTPRIARWIGEREGRAPDADGSITIVHPVADGDWAERHVLQYGPDAEVLSPPALRERLVRRLRAIADDTAGPDA